MTASGWPWPAARLEPLPAAKPEEAVAKPAPAKRTWTQHAKKEEPPPRKAEIGHLLLVQQQETLSHSAEAWNRLLKPI